MLEIKEIIFFRDGGSFFPAFKLLITEFRLPCERQLQKLSAEIAFQSYNALCFADMKKKYKINAIKLYLRACQLSLMLLKRLIDGALRKTDD